MKVSKNTSIYLTSKDTNCRLEKINERDLAIESNPKFQSIKLDKDKIEKENCITENYSDYLQLSKFIARESVQPIKLQLNSSSEKLFNIWNPFVIYTI